MRFLLSLEVKLLLLLLEVKLLLLFLEVNRSTWGRPWAVNVRLRARACSGDAGHTVRRIWVLFFAQNPTLRG